MQILSHTATRDAGAYGWHQFRRIWERQLWRFSLAWPRVAPYQDFLRAWPQVALYQERVF
jgi:hypothetical protein